MQRILEIACAILMAGIVVLLNVQIAVRHLGAGSVPWSGEMATWLFSWSTFIGAVLLEDIFAMGFNALHPIDPNCYDIREFKRRHGHKTVIIGNVNLNNLGGGTPETVTRETMGLIRDLGPGYGWCISASNSVPDYVKPENLMALAQTIRQYGSYPILTSL